jgi:ribosomal protein L37E
MAVQFASRNTLPGSPAWGSAHAVDEAGAPVCGKVFAKSSRKQEAAEVTCPACKRKATHRDPALCTACDHPRHDGTMHGAAHPCTFGQANHCPLDPIGHLPCGGSTWSQDDPLCALCGRRYSAHEARA